MVVKGIDFISNDFLGFARSSRLSQEVYRRYHEMSSQSQQEWLGAGGSRLMVGTSSIMQRLEEKIAAYHGVQDAFVVHSGYMANLGLCYHVASDHDVLLWDEYVHMSVKYSLCAAKGTCQAFRHNDVNHLETLLRHYRNCTSGRIFVFVCSVYSFTGTLAPLKEILSLVEKYNARLVVDEAHAIGIFGEGGRGLCYDLGYENIYASLVTFGKALGGMGAAILTSTEVKEDLLHNSPPLRYSTGLAPSVLVAIDVAYDFLSLLGDVARQQLGIVQQHFFQRYPDHTMGCVQPIYVETSVFDSMVAALQEQDIHVGVVSFMGAEPFIRVNLHAYNSIEEVDALIDALEPYLEKRCCGIHVNHELHFRGELS